ELLGVQPPDRVVLAQQRRRAVPVVVRGADVRVGGRHHDPSAFPAEPTPAGACARAGTRPALAAARPLAPPSAAVRTQGPSAVMATVCSKWAARLPSAVTTVQSSSSSRVSGP